MHILAKMGFVAQNLMHLKRKLGLLSKINVEMSVFRAKQVILGSENRELPKDTNIIS